MQNYYYYLNYANLFQEISFFSILLPLNHQTTRNMKILLINGSPHANGCTFTALEEVRKTLETEGIETEMIHIGHKDIRGCTACYSCKKNGYCIFDDSVNDVAKTFESADGIVIGSPVYFAGIAGTLKSFLDRLFMSTSFDKRMKVGAAVVSARRGGNSATFDIINKYFTMTQMPVVTSQYWNQVHGGTPEDVKKDTEGLQTMRVLARNIAFLVKGIKLAKEQYGLPTAEQRIYTNFAEGK